MKNKNLWVFGIIILVLCFGAGILIRHSNENEKKDIIPTVNKLRGIADLATIETTYHNVAKYDNPGTAFLFLKNNKKLWIEYEGTVKIGTDISQLQMEMDGNKIKVTMPHSKILRKGISINADSLDKDHYYSDKEGLFVSDITFEDEKKAYSKANESMKKETKKNTILFVQADERAKELIENYIKNIEIPDTFNLHLDITKVRGLEADYEWSEADDENYGRDAGYYKYEGDWSFDIPVTVDDSQTEVMELNDTNDAGIGLRSVIRTPYELTVNELYEEGSNSDCFMVALDANGNKLPYNDSVGNCNIFAIQDRDISTVDIYILDYIQYMDELKGEDNYNNNETKPEGQKWSDLLDQYAKYHKTLHFN